MTQKEIEQALLDNPKKFFRDNLSLVDDLKQFINTSDIARDIAVDILSQEYFEDDHYDVKDTLLESGAISQSVYDKWDTMDFSSQLDYAVKDVQDILVSDYNNNLLDFLQYMLPDYSVIDIFDIYFSDDDEFVDAFVDTISSKYYGKEFNFQKVTPEYTGGGVYLFTGKCNGEYFLADSDYFDVTFIDADPDDFEFEDLWESDFFDTHMITYINPDSKDSTMFFKQMCRWIIDNRPQGNYAIEDIETILENI